ncbi:MULTISPECIES: hypothetical protein [Psychrobacillus]|uniref:hypothetical protein n=1 Tax=Psychrobacillus TaxID=1221880 RepID=UPI000B829EBC|nr:hypothetical protein [Psychrobacillus psychrotolerans]
MFYILFLLCLTSSEELVEELTEPKFKVITQKQMFSESSKDKLMESLRRIAILDNENKKMKNNNARLLGKLTNR